MGREPGTWGHRPLVIECTPFGHLQAGVFPFLNLSFLMFKRKRTCPQMTFRQGQVQ